MNGFKDKPEEPGSSAISILSGMKETLEKAKELVAFQETTDDDLLLSIVFELKNAGVPILGIIVNALDAYDIEDIALSHTKEVWQTAKEFTARIYSLF